MPVDFFIVPAVASRVSFVFVVLVHDRHRVIHLNVTEQPTAAQMARQIVEAFPWNTAPRYLLRNRHTRVRGVGVEEKGSAVAQLRIVCQDGEPDPVVEARQARYSQKITAELPAQGLAPKEIAARLNAMGIITRRGQIVAKAIERMAKQTPQGAGRKAR